MSPIKHSQYQSITTDLRKETPEQSRNTYPPGLARYEQEIITLRQDYVRWLIAYKVKQFNSGVLGHILNNEFEGKLNI